jgi:hypothetical protein
MAQQLYRLQHLVTACHTPVPLVVRDESHILARLQGGKYLLLTSISLLYYNLYIIYIIIYILTYISSLLSYISSTILL